MTFALLRLAFASAPRLPLNLAMHGNSPVHSSIGTPSHVYSASTVRRHTVSGSISLRSPGSFHLSLTVLSSIGRSVVFSLGWWSTLLPTRFLVSRGTLDTGPLKSLSGTRVSLSVPSLPRLFPWRFFALCRSATPGARRLPVWALPVSLAATQGISVDFFSSGYLDVSVHRVSLLDDDTRMYRVAPFGYPWINACLRLPMTFRSLPRPSSSLNAKASAVCPL